MITARYIWETETLLRGFDLHRHTMWIAKVGPIVGIGFLIFAAYQAFVTKAWLDALPVFILATVLLLAARVLPVWRFRKAVRQSPYYGAEITWTFDPQQIVLAGEGFHSTFTWSKVFAAAISGEGLLLYPQKNLFHWIPASAFTSSTDLDAIRGLLTQHGVRTREL